MLVKKPKLNTFNNVKKNVSYTLSNQTITKGFNGLSALLSEVTNVL